MRVERTCLGRLVIAVLNIRSGIQMAVLPGESFAHCFRKNRCILEGIHDGENMLLDANAFRHITIVRNQQKVRQDAVARRGIRPNLRINNVQRNIC